VVSSGGGGDTPHTTLPPPPPSSPAGFGIKVRDELSVLLHIDTDPSKIKLFRDDGECRHWRGPALTWCSNSSGTERLLLLHKSNTQRIAELVLTFRPHHAPQLNTPNTQPRNADAKHATKMRVAFPDQEFLHVEVNGAHRDDLLYSGKLLRPSPDVLIYFPPAQAVNPGDAKDGPLAVIKTSKFELTVLKETEDAAQ